MRERLARVGRPMDVSTVVKDALLPGRVQGPSESGSSERKSAFTECPQ
jgi:hypothetical protein